MSERPRIRSTDHADKNPSRIAVFRSDIAVFRSKHIWDWEVWYGHKFLTSFRTHAEALEWALEQVGLGPHPAATHKEGA